HGREVAAGIDRRRDGHAVQGDLHTANRREAAGGGDVAGQSSRGGAVGDRRRGQSAEDGRRPNDVGRCGCGRRGELVIEAGESDESQPRDGYRLGRTRVGVVELGGAAGQNHVVVIDDSAARVATHRDEFVRGDRRYCGCVVRLAVDRDTWR